MSLAISYIQRDMIDIKRIILIWWAHHGRTCRCLLGEIWHIFSRRWSSSIGSQALPRIHWCRSWDCRTSPIAFLWGGRVIIYNSFSRCWWPRLGRRWIISLAQGCWRLLYCLQTHLALQVWSQSRAIRTCHGQWMRHHRWVQSWSVHMHSCRTTRLSSSAS